MQLEVRKYLFDMQQACDLLAQFTGQKTLADYRADAMLRSAVERQFEIIGEALNQALKIAPGLVSRISETKRIISFRNILVHGYAHIADDIVWGLLETNLPTLRRELEQLLAEPEGG